MADRIKGITIEIGGDTRLLKESLKEVDASLKDTQAALKDTNKLLKFDPANTELLKQKQKDLAQAISETEVRLKALKSQEGNMKEALASGKITQSQYDAYQREIVDTEVKLKSLTDQQKAFGSVAAQQLKAAGESMKEFGSKATSVGTSLSKYLTAPIVAVTAAAGKAFSEVDTAADTIIKKTGATGAAADSLKSVMEDIATDIPVSFADAGNAVGEVNTRFGATGDTLKSLSEQFLQFAEINGADVSDSIDNVDKIMKRFGVSSDEAGNVLGVLSKAGQATGLSMEDLYSSLEKSSDQMQSLGFNLYDTVNILAEMDANGINAQTAFKGLQKAQATAAKEGKTLQDVMGDLVEKIQSGASETEILSDATNLFGTKAAAEMVKALKDGSLALGTATGNMKDYSTVVSQTYEATIDPIDDAKKAINELKATGSDLFEAIQKSAAPMIEDLSDMLAGLKDKWDGLDDGTQQMIVRCGAVVAAVGPVLAVGGKLVSGIGSMISTLAPLLASTGPIGLAITAAGVLAGGIAVVSGNLREAEKETAKLSQAGTDLEESVKNSASAIQDADTQYALTTGTVEGLLDQLDELASQLQAQKQAGDDTTATQQAYNAVLQQLQDSVPNLNVQIDQQTGLLLTNRDAILQQADAWAESQRQQAYQEAFGDIIKKQAKAEAELAYRQAELSAAQKGYSDAVEESTRQTQLYNEAEAKYNENLDASAETQKKYTDAMTAAAEAQGKAQASAEEYQGKINDLTTAVEKDKQALKDTKDDVDMAKEAMKNLSQQTGSTASKMDDVTDAVKDSGSAADDAAESIDGLSDSLDDSADSAEDAAKVLGELPTKYKGIYADTKKTVDGQIGLFAKLDDSVSASVDDMVASLEQQQQYMIDYADNIQKAAQMGIDDGLLKSLSDGSEQSAAYLQAIVDGGQEAVDKINAAWKQTNAIKTTYTGALANAKAGGQAVIDQTISQAWNGGYAIGNAYGNGMYNRQDYVGSASKSLANAAINKLDIWQSAYNIGANGGEGFAQGLVSKLSAVSGAAYSLGSTATQGLRTTLMVRSPSKVMAKIGAYATEGFAIGMKQELGSVRDAADQVAGAAMSINAGTYGMAGQTAEVGGRTNEMIGRLITLVSGMANSQSRDLKVVMDSGALVGAITDQMDGALGAKTRMAERGVAY